MRKKRSGFAIVEILISLVLIAILFGLVSAAQQSFSRKSRVKKAFHFLRALNRRLYTSAKIRSQTYRLAIKIDPKGPESVFVERELPRPALPSPYAEAGEARSAPSKEDQKRFALDSSFLKRERALPPILALTSAEGQFWEKPASQGLVFIHYRPQGPGDDIALHFKREDSGHEWTLHFPAITRELKLLKGNIPLKELQDGGA